MALGITIQYAALERAATGLRGAVATVISKDVLIAAGTQVIVRSLQEAAPRKTGAGAASIQAKDNGVYAFRYMAWQDEGTGIYGPTGKPIVPVHARVLRFVVNGQVVFAKSVKGSGMHKGWVRRGADASKPELEVLMLENGRRMVNMIQSGG